MAAAIAMSALSLGAVLELALAAAIRSRADRRRSSIDSTSTAAGRAANVTGR